MVWPTRCIDGLPGRKSFAGAVKPDWPNENNISYIVARQYATLVKIRFHPSIPLRILPLIALALFGVVALPSAALAAPDMEAELRPGVYVGGIGRPPQFVFTRLEVKSADSGALSATMTQPVDRVGEFAVENLRADASRLQFSSGGDAFDLRRTETGYAGSARDAKGAVRPVSLVLRDWAPAERLEAYQGVFDLGGGRTIALGLGNQKSGFFYLERPSELTGVAIGVSPVEFIAGDCFCCVDPVRLRF